MSLELQRWLAVLWQADVCVLQFGTHFCAMLQLGKAFSGPKVEDNNYVKAKLVLQTTGFPVSSHCPLSSLQNCQCGRVCDAPSCYLDTEGTYGLMRSNTRSG